MNIFERAARRRLRFDSSVGLLSTEDLFTLDLIHKTKPNLRAIGMGIKKELDSMGDEFDLVDIKPNERKEELELQFEIVKHIIESKKADALAAQTRAETLEKRKKLLSILESKKEEAYKNMTPEQIEAELAKLGA